jgi:prepilin-type processing-associated H-X9-DG protein
MFTAVPPTGTLRDPLVSRTGTRKGSLAMPASIRRNFGSAHADGRHFTFVDGSVRSISYEIDDRTHRRLAHRADGTVAHEGE